MKTWHDYLLRLPCADYLLALFDADEEPTSEQLVTELRESMRQAINGDTLPLDDLWAALDEADAADGR